MSLIQELSRYLEAKFDSEHIVKENKHLKMENLTLKNTNLILENKIQELKSELNSVKESKKGALDEIILNHKRIDALLRQLSEKNNGK